MSKECVEEASQTPPLTERCKAILAMVQLESHQPTYLSKTMPETVTIAPAGPATNLQSLSRRSANHGTLQIAPPDAHPLSLSVPPGCICPGIAGYGGEGLVTPDVTQMLKTNQTRAMSGPPAVPVKKSAYIDLYVLGGYNGTTFDMDECKHMFKYDATSKQWGAVGEMPVPRFHHTAVAYGEYIYVIGGASISCADSARSTEEAGQVLSPTATNYRYHPATRTWTEQPPMKTRRVYHSAAAGFGSIYIFGGQNEEQTILGTVEIYEIDQKRWRIGPSLRHPVMGSSATLSGGFIYIVGGITEPLIKTGPRVDRFNVINRAHYLDVYSNEWIALPSLPIPLVHHVGVCLNGEILIIGGSTSGRPKPKEKTKPHLISRKDMYAYNEDGKKWELVGSLSEPRSGCGAAVVGSDICILGGHGLVEGEVLNTMEHFDLYAKQLTPGSSLPLKRTALQLVAFPSVFHNHPPHGRGTL